MPTGEALSALVEAKLATGYPGRVMPCKAVQGSPGPILAIGMTPDWLVDYALVPDFSDVGRLTAALTALLLHPEDPRIGREENLLSKWMECDVTYTGTEEGVWA